MQAKSDFHHRIHSYMHLAKKYKITIFSFFDFGTKKFVRNLISLIENIQDILFFGKNRLKGLK